MSGNGWQRESDSMGLADGKYHEGVVRLEVSGGGW